MTFKKNKKGNRVYPESFKRKLIAQITAGEISGAEAAVKYGIAHSLLSGWKKKFPVTPRPHAGLKPPASENGPRPVPGSHLAPKNQLVYLKRLCADLLLEKHMREHGA